MWKDKDIDAFLDDEKGQVRLQSDSDIDAFLDDGVPSAPSGKPTMRDKLLGMAAKAAPIAAKALSPLMPMAAPLQAYDAFKTAGDIGGPGQLAGDAVSNKLIAGGTNPTLAKGAGIATSVVLDPSTFIGGGAGFAAGKAGAQAVGKKVAPTLFKVLADVPEQATKVLMETKDLFKKATGTSDAIESAVTNIQKAMKESMAAEGREMAKVEKFLKIEKTPEALRQEIMKGRGEGALKAELSKLNSADLLGKYEQVKQALPQLSAGEKILTLRTFQQEMNSRVTSFATKGDSMTGLLKTTAKEAAGEIKNTPGGELLRAVQAKYARAQRTYDSLDSLLRKDADSGQAEQMLMNVFKSDAPRYRSIRRGLADLEKTTGQPVLTKLFQEFATQALNKIVGRPALAGSAGGMVMSGSATFPFHPIAGAAQIGAGLTLGAAQSPKVLGTVARAPGAVGGVVGGAAGAGLAGLFNRVNKESLPE